MEPCPSVRLSVSPSTGPQQYTRGCRFAAEGPASGELLKVYTLHILPARRYASAGTSYGPVSVCLSQVGVLSKWIDGSS